MTDEQKPNSETGFDAALSIDEPSLRLLDTAPICGVFWDENGNCLACNAETQRLFGLSCKEDFIHHYKELSPKFQPSGRLSEGGLQEKLIEAFEKGRVVFEWVHQDLQGRPIPTEVTLVRLDDQARRLVVAYIRDLRDLKKTENERDRERLLLLDVLNSSPVCFTIIVDTKIRFVTPFMSEFLGVCAGDDFRSFFASENAGDLLRKELADSRILNWHPLTLRTKDGGFKEMLANMSFIDYYGTDATMVWLVDVTQIRKAESELRLARDAAEASVKAKSEFLANMSHEIRTPMNAILGMTHLALRTGLTPKQTEYIEGVEQSAKLLLRIINDILDFSKIEAGRMVMEYHEFSIQEVIDDLQSVVQEAARKKNLPLFFDLLPEVPERVMGDSVRLRQVLLNLINNAIKFTDQGGVRISVRPLELDGLSAELEFAVQDSGIGMTPEQIRLLFRPFSQADTSTTRKYGGTGLGLAISRSLVEMMKGTISCDSKAGHGTVFTFTARFGLPLEGDSLDDVSEIRTDALLLGDRTHTLRIVRHYLDLLKSKVVTQCETAEDLERFLAEDRMNEVDFIILSFDELLEKGLPILQLLHERLGDRVPPMGISIHPKIDRIQDGWQFSTPFQVIQEPVVVSELFNIMMGVTAKKKELMLLERKREQQDPDAGHEKIPGFNIPAAIRDARILLAEDNRINQIVASEMLRMEGFIVDIADNGSRAVEMIRTNPYDLVLMDIQMPEMDGLEAARLIRADSRFDSLPILAMTAHAMTGDRELSLEAGMNDHITKPIDPKLLFCALAKWIRRLDCDQ